MVALHWEKYFQHAVEKYNRIYQNQLPKITPHVCGHTYCSNMANAGMNPKVLQYLMGHSDSWMMQKRRWRSLLRSRRKPMMNCGSWYRILKEWDLR